MHIDIEWCAHGARVVYMHNYGGCVYALSGCQTSLVFLLLLEWTRADPLCCCCWDCLVTSVSPNWMEALLVGALYFCCQVVRISRLPLGTAPSSTRQPLRRFVPHPPVGVLLAPIHNLGRLTDQCVVVTPSSVAEDVSPYSLPFG